MLNEVTLKEVSFLKASDTIFGFTTNYGCKSPMGCLQGDGGVVVLFDTAECTLLECGSCPPTMHRGNEPFVCITCEAGRYNPKRNQSVCTACPDGFYSSESGLMTVSQCKVCAVGNSCSEGQMQKCAQGTFGDVPQLSTCKHQLPLQLSCMTMQ